MVARRSVTNRRSTATLGAGFTSKSTFSHIFRSTRARRGRVFGRPLAPHPVGMNASRVFNAVLFDLDGVLVDSHVVVERTWQRWMRSRSLDIPDIVLRAHGRRSFDTVREIAPHLDTVAEVRWLAAAEEADLDGIVALPGAAAALGALANDRRAIVTSGGRVLARTRLEHVGLPVPEVLVAAEDVHEGKPSPEPYLVAARRLGVDPSNCVVFEDTPAGVEAGRAAGATVLGIATTFSAEALREASAVIASLAAVEVLPTDAGFLLHITGETR
jgi:sugar-phosphatase